MSTFTDSKYRKSREERACQICAGTILERDLYLDYKIGQRRSTRVCYDCSLQVNLYGPRFNCADVVDELNQRGMPLMEES